jgi:hypothetical protein
MASRGRGLAAKILLAQTIALDHGTHTTVQNQNAFI